jgi:F-type H+-transporting ATPase subunit c
MHDEARHGARPRTEIPHMKNTTTIAIIAAATAASTVLADTAAAGPSWGTGIGAGMVGGLAVIGAGLGIGKIGASANESTARQPEMGGRIFTNMILTAALVEGVALFAVVVSLLGINK